MPDPRFPPYTLRRFQEWPTRARRVALSAGAVLVVAAVAALLIFGGLPAAEEIQKYKPASTVQAGAVNWRQEPQQAIRIWAPLKQISPLLQEAVILSEDDLFYHHDGVNVDMMLDAFAVNWRKKGYVRGASTITMQLARNAFLTREKTILRKIRELVLAKRIEKHLTKSQILERYLNIVEWGRNIYGAEAAARYYFGKHASNLNLNEATLLAGMLPNPVYFNPFKRLQSCRRMQKRVLWLLQINRKITKERSAAAYASAVYLRGGTPEFQTAGIDSQEEAKYAIPELEDPLRALPPRHSPSIDSTIQLHISSTDTTYPPSDSAAADTAAGDTSSINTSSITDSLDSSAR